MRAVQKRVSIGILLCLMVGSVLLFSAEPAPKRFGIESGMVFYSINGGGKLTSDVNISISGTGKLQFEKWGENVLIEEKYDQETTGVLKDNEQIMVCTGLRGDTRLDVDFKTEKILERKIPKGAFLKHFTEGLVKNGQEKIAGYVCDIWEKEGVRKCMYKGIPLLVEHYLAGVYYEKKAINVIFHDYPSPSECCRMPEYPIERFALFNTNIKTKSVKLPKALPEIIDRVSETMQKEAQNRNIAAEILEEKQKRVWLDKIGENVFKHQKVFLPDFLLRMKKARVCLQQADNWMDANRCAEDIKHLKEKFSKKREAYTELWKEKEKNLVLDELDEEISLLQSQMKCIRAAKNLTDLSLCRKQ